MPGLPEVKAEIWAAAEGGDPAPHDTVRRRHMRRLAAVTGNTVAVYATSFVQKPADSDPSLAITNEDVHAFMNILHGADKGKGLDLILHSPGGSPEAAEGIADYLHGHFAGRKIRVIVPYMAMSAATMLACAADSVVMGEHSSLGPVDPQLTLLQGGVPWTIAAHSVVREFDYLMSRGPDFAGGWVENALARGHIDSRHLPALKPRMLGAWSEIVLARYGGMGIIDACRRQIAMSEKLICGYLCRRMFVDDSKRKEKAEELAAYLADHDHFLSHGRRVSPSTAREKGMTVEKLEEDSNFQDAVLSVFHALCLAFSDTRAGKIIENDSGRAFTRIVPRRNSP